MEEKELLRKAIDTLIDVLSDCCDVIECSEEKIILDSIYINSYEDAFLFLLKNFDWVKGDYTRIEIDRKKYLNWYHFGSLPKELEFKREEEDFR
jgi:hypothetical protein